MIFVPPPLTSLLRERRLLLLGAASALLHLVALAWLAGPPRARQPAPQRALALQVELRGAPVPRAAPSPPPQPQAAAPATVLATASANATPAPRRQMARTITPPPPLATATAAATVEKAATTSTLPASAGWDVGADGDNGEAPHQAGFQAVQAPPPARLQYAVTRAAAPGAAEIDGGVASLAWHAGDGGYIMAMDGVIGAVQSRGQMSDNGFVPLAATSRATDGAIDTIEFDWRAARARFGRSGAAQLAAADAQDRASMLMRLAGMGLAGAVQLEGTIELQVAGSGALATVRFERLAENEVIDTALGALTTVHLAQLAGAGQPRLEVWLAPQHGWYPVKLKVTAADGSSATQTVTALTVTP